MIGKIRRGLDAVRLRGGIGLRRPARAAIHRHDGAAVVAQDHPRGVVRIDPEIVVIAVSRVDEVVGRAAVGRLRQREVQDVDGVRVARVRDHAIEVERTLPEIAIRVDQPPRCAGVVRSIQAARLGFDDGIEAPRVGAGHADADLADRPVRQARRVRDLAPGVAAIGGLEESGTRSAARELPRNPGDLPERRVDRVGVLRIDRQIDCAGPGVAKEHARPAAAAIARTIDASRLGGLRRIAERRRVNDVGIGGMDAQARDGQGVGQSDVFPVLPRVARFVDTVALHDVAAQLRLTHADVDDVGIGGRHRDRADRGAGNLSVGDRRPRRARRRWSSTARRRWRRSSTRTDVRPIRPPRSIGRRAADRCSATAENRAEPNGSAARGCAEDATPATDASVNTKAAVRCSILEVQSST